MKKKLILFFKIFFFPFLKCETCSVDTSHAKIELLVRQ